MKPQRKPFGLAMVAVGMNLAQRFLFSCVKLLAIWLRNPQLLQAHMGKQCMYVAVYVMFPERMAHTCKIFENCLLA